MERVKINNLGFIPLAGVCSYEDACRIGLDIERNVDLLKRYNYAATQLNQICAAHIADAPEWEVKCAFGLHLWLDAEHSAALRKRVSEMREPPLYLDKVPDDRLEAFFQELIRANNTLELLVGLYGVARPELARVLRSHLQLTNPLVDQPTCRILRWMLLEEEEMIAWGEQAIAAVTRTEADRQAAERWRAHLQSFLYAAGGFSGDLARPAGEAVDVEAPRWDGTPYVLKPEPRRDSRFVDNYNGAARIDTYYRDETLPADERTYALLYKRLREMDVPEWMGPILYKTKGKPWEYYQDLSRQLWDEVRHAMLGEVGLYQDGVAFYSYPIEFKTSMALNTKFDPLDAHIVLWYIEQSLMPKETGKRLEWVIAKSSDNELARTFQDYDWADEVLHAQIGRKWLIPEAGGLDELKRRGEAIMQRNLAEKEKLDTRSDQKQWWPAFLADIRRGRERIRGKAQ